MLFRSQASGILEAETVISGALVKIAPVDPNVPRGLGMRQMLTEEAKWEELAGAACAGYSGCSEEASKPSMAFLSYIAAQCQLGSQRISCKAKVGPSLERWGVLSKGGSPKCRFAALAGKAC